ncbi:ATP synthase F1 subunit gamma [Candidatus Daviesbacteria bacterium]|nr:ATP synthase F1 subunit gamma [Candidatus Daviesbacteria bacterium]
MANTRELRRRIKSVKNTAQITRAMQMVAATKMRRAQSQALNGRPYNFNLNYALRKLLPLVDIGSHPLLLGNDCKTYGVILLSTDKSLCGALNTNIFRMLTTSVLPSDTYFYTVGKKGRQFIAKTGKNLVADFENLDVVTFRQAAQLAKLVISAYLNKEIGEAYLAYPNFISTLRQEPRLVKLLPVSISDIEYRISEDKNDKQSLRSNDLKRLTINDKQTGEFLFEPDSSTLLDFTLNHFIQIKIYQSLLETKAAEHSARMVAMQNATDNALELVDDLSLTYNQTRQSAITTEILDITTAQLALE